MSELDALATLSALIQALGAAAAAIALGALVIVAGMEAAEGLRALVAWWKGRARG